MPPGPTVTAENLLLFLTALGRGRDCVAAADPGPGPGRVTLPLSLSSSHETSDLPVPGRETFFFCMCVPCNFLVASSICLASQWFSSAVAGSGHWLSARRTAVPSASGRDCRLSVSSLRHLMHQSASGASTGYFFFKKKKEVHR